MLFICYLLDINENDVITTLISKGKTLRASIIESTASVDLEPIELPSRDKCDTTGQEKRRRWVDIHCANVVFIGYTTSKNLHYLEVSRVIFLDPIAW